MDFVKAYLTRFRRFATPAVAGLAVLVVLGVAGLAVGARFLVPAKVHVASQEAAKAEQVRVTAMKADTLPAKLSGLAQALSLYDQAILGDPDIEHSANFTRLLNDYASGLQTSAANPVLAPEDRRRQLTTARFVALRQPDAKVCAPELISIATQQMQLGSNDDAVESLTAGFVKVEGLAPVQRDALVSDMTELLALVDGNRPKANLWATSVTDPQQRAGLLAYIAYRQLHAGEFVEPELAGFQGLDLGHAQARSPELLQTAGILLQRGDWPGAVAAALTAGTSTPGRDAALSAMINRVETRAQLDAAEPAAFGISNGQLQNNALFVLALRNAASHRLTIAERLAGGLIDPVQKAQALSSIAEQYAESHLTLSARPIMAQVVTMTNNSMPQAAKSRINFDLAMAHIRLAEYDRAVVFARRITESGAKLAVFQKIASDEIGLGNWSVAETGIREIRNLGGMENAVVLKAALLSARRRPAVIEGLVTPGMSLPTRFWVLAYAADAFAGTGDLGTATRKVVALEGLGKRAQTANEKQQYACAALFAYASIGEPGKAESNLAAGMAQDTDACRQAVKQLAVAWAKTGQLSQVDRLMAMARDDKQRSQVLPRVVDYLIDGENFQLAATYAKQIPSYEVRVGALHRLAEASAKQLDTYNVLDGTRFQAGSFFSGGRDVIMGSDDVVYYDFANKSEGDRVPTPPRLDRYGRHEIGTAIPRATPGRAYVIPMEYNGYNSKFISQVNTVFREIGDKEYPVQAQGTRYPLYIQVESGVFTLESLARQLAERGRSDLLVNQGSRYQLNIPLLIGPEASLVLSGTDAKELRLNANTGVFIVNAGHLWFHDITVAGWDEAGKKYAELDFETRRQFRPFIITWGGAELNADGSHFHHLGFSGNIGYGFSYSQGPNQIEQERPGSLKPPTGTVVENSFEDMYFGFFTNGANDVALVGNEYKNNLIYGIDPHDYSKRLIIAYNTSYGTIKKHGIIASREVDNSWIIGNVVFENHGTGIMLDRASSGNFVYANRVWSNGQEGMALYESACNILAANTTINNGGDALKIRNSIDVGVFRNRLSAGQKSGINIYVGDPKAVPGFAVRDIKRDPYSKYVSASLIGNDIEMGQGSAVTATGFGAVAFLGNHFFKAQNLLQGDLQPLTSNLLRFQTEGVVVRSTCPAIRSRKVCPFASGGFLNSTIDDLPPAAGKGGNCAGIADVDDASDPDDLLSGI